MSHDRDERRNRPYTADEIARARELRRSGWGIQEISDELGMGLSTVHKFVKDVSVPKPPETAKRSVSSYERERRQRLVNEKTGAIRWQVNDPSTEDALQLPHLTMMPKDASAYDTSGLLPDPELATHAWAVIETWLNDLAKGVIFDRRSPEITKAIYVTLHTYELWDYQHFLRNRHEWRIVRDLANIDAAAFGQRVGISASSVSRYEKNQRQPDPSIIKKLHIAYAAVLEEALWHAEWSLAFDSCFEHFAREKGVDVADVEIDGDAALRWIVGIGPNDEGWDDPAHFTHLDHILQMRSLMPHPAWRQPTAENFLLIGYGNEMEDEIEGAA